MEELAAVDSDEELQKKILAFTGCNWKDGNSLHQMASYLVYKNYYSTPEKIANTIVNGTGID